jgi:hypothetical protein
MDAILNILLQQNKKVIIDDYDMLVIYVYSFIFHNFPENKVRKNVLFKLKQYFFSLYRSYIM